MRLTIHLCSAADYWPLALAIRAARRDLWLRARHQARAAGRSRRGDAARGACKDGPLRRKEIEALVGKDAMQRRRAWLDLVRVPPPGTWEQRRADLYGLAEDWLPQPDGSTTRSEHLVARYLTGFGPGGAGRHRELGRHDHTGTSAPRSTVSPRTRPRTARRSTTSRTSRCPTADTPAPGAVPAHVGRAAARPRPPRADPARGHRAKVFHTKMPQSIGTFLVDGQVAGTWKPDGTRHAARGPDKRATHPGGQRSRGGWPTSWPDLVRLRRARRTVHRLRWRRPTRTPPTCSSCQRPPRPTGRRSSPTRRSCTSARASRSSRRARTSRALYLLTEGTVGVRLPRDEGAFKTIEAPSVLGELAFFDGQPRSATLEAATDVEVVRLDLSAFDRLLEHEPALAHRCSATSRASSRSACGWPPT